MPRPRWPLLLTVLLIATLLFAACGGDDDDDDDASTPTPTPTATPTSGGGGSERVAVTLSDFQIESASANVSAGEITFAVDNAGSLEHELVVVRTDLAFDGLPVESALVPLDDAGFDGVVEGDTDPFSPGGERELTVNLEAGSYVLLCNVAGHYELGMRIAFTVN